MCVILLNNAGWCCLKPPILREILRTPNLLRVEHCAFWEVIHLFQTSSTESEIIALDGIPSLDYWDLIVSVLRNTTQKHDRTVRPVVCPQTNHGRQHSRRVINDLDNDLFLPSNVQFSHQDASVYVFEDNEAVIKMIIRRKESQDNETCFQNPQSCS